MRSDRFVGIFSGDRKRQRQVNVPSAGRRKEMISPNPAVAC
jgi:hypothetical protein